MQTTEYAGAKADLRATRILCGALLAGVAVFAIIILLLVNFNMGPVFGASEIAQWGDIFLAVCGGIALLCFFMAYKHYKRSIGQVQSQLTLKDKFNEYRAVLIRYMALCEGPALFGIICFFITGIYYFLAITALMSAAMLWKAPFGRKYVTEMNLDWKEQQELL